MRETLTAAARLRLPVSAHSYIEEIVTDTIRELGLSACADTTVGGSGTGGAKGISGGEKRRLSIGCVLVSFPSVLILDEVTTGLGEHLILTTVSFVYYPDYYYEPPRFIHRIPPPPNPLPTR